MDATWRQREEDWEAEESPARFVLEMGRSLHEAGAPAHRLEKAMVTIAGRLGLRAEVFSTPTAIFASFGPLSDQRSFMMRVEPGALDLERMIRVDRVIQRVGSGEIEVAEGAERLRSIPRPSDRWPRPARVLAFGVSSTAASVFLGAGLGDLLAAWVVGLIVGAISVYGAAFRDAALVLQAVSAVVATSIALCLERYASPWLLERGVGWAGVDSVLVTLSGLIVLLPGLTLTLAMSELASRQLVSGTGRLTSAVMTLISVGFGVAVGRSFESVMPPGSVAPVDAPAWLIAVALAVAPCAHTVLFRARPWDLAIIGVTGVLGFLGARAGAAWIGPEVGVSVGAFVVGVVANGYSRVFDMPFSVAGTPGLMLLVPGSLGYRSIESLIGDDVLAGVQGIFSTLLVGASLVVGLLLANVVLPVKRLV
ncbi:MAG: threonine/serine exporter family protein [Planctomycetota bacterium]